MSRPQRLELLLFIACFFTFAYFNQGGGWNQNSRFAEVRAMVEEGRFAIDDFLVYVRDADTDDLFRVPVENAEYRLDGKRYRLCWIDMEWTYFPVGDAPLEKGVEKAAMVETCSSGDIGYVPWTGHFHPNKPPGTSFLALPGYFAIYHIEKWLSIDPNRWWTVDVNAWLASVCSVALISALGCVLFFRLACEFSGGNVLAAALATITFAFGTTFLPFSTLLFDHNLTASLLIAAFYYLRRGVSSPWRFIVGGVCAGLSATTNYLAFVAVFLLGVYALFGVERKVSWRAAIYFSVGAIPPMLLLAWYGWECFGSFKALNTNFQNPLFKDTEGFLGMFGPPSPYVISYLLVSPIRGLLFFSPVLILSIYGFVVWFRQKLAPEALLCLAMAGWFFFIIACFNGYHGGFSAGPRYLIPCIPFLALALGPAFARLRWLACSLAVVSILMNVLLTATDAQNPVGIGGHCRISGRNEWTYNLIGDYAWPLFVSDRAWPLLEQEIDVQLEKDANSLDAQASTPAELEKHSASTRKEYMASIDRGEASPFLLGSVEGPVSVNPVGAFEGLFNYEYFPPGSPQVRWASFNLGEFLWPQSRLSLLPLLFITGGLCGLVVFSAAK
ncbi:MAG TPA: hypothetical protein VGH90_09440, partial [Chthoniobacteraceae bacterium]